MINLGFGQSLPQCCWSVWACFIFKEQIQSLMSKMFCCFTWLNRHGVQQRPSIRPESTDGTRSPNSFYTTRIESISTDERERLDIGEGVELYRGKGSVGMGQSERGDKSVKYTNVTIIHEGNEKRSRTDQSRSDETANIDSVLLSVVVLFLPSRLLC